MHKIKAFNLCIYVRDEIRENNVIKGYSGSSVQILVTGI